MPSFVASKSGYLARHWRGCCEKSPLKINQLAELLKLANILSLISAN